MDSVLSNHVIALILVLETPPWAYRFMRVCVYMFMCAC